MFEVGDSVRIKSWEQMEQEFKLDDSGDIECSTECFLTDMKDLCGMELTIEEIYDDQIQNIEGWTITFDMIEKI